MREPNRYSENDYPLAGGSSYLPVSAAQTVIEASPEGPQLDVVKLLRRYSLIAVLLTIVGAAAGFFSVGLMTPAYKANALLEVQPISSGILKMQDSGDLGVQISLLTEAQVLRSNTFLVNVIQRLKSESLTGAPVRKDIFAQLRGLLNKNSSDDFASALGAAGVNADATPTSMTMALRTLEAHPLPDTHLLQISCDSTDPQFTADFINAVIDEYIQHNYQARMDSVRTTTQWISGQLEETKAKLMQADERLQEFMRSSGNTFVTQENTLAQANLQELQGRLSAAEADLVAKRALYDMAQTSKPEALANLIDDPAVRQYQARIADLRREEALLTTTLTPEHPKVKRIETQIAELQAGEQKEVNAAIKRIASQYEQAQRNQELMKTAYSKAAAQVSSQTSKEAQYDTLKKQSELAREAYNSVLLQANQASIAGSLPVNNIQIIDRAVPPLRPYKPRPMMNIGMGAMAGLALCCGIAFLREKMDHRVGSPHQTRQMFNLPQLGVIPTVEEGRTRRRFLANPRWKNRLEPVNGDEASVISDGAPELAQHAVLRQPPLAESFRVTLASLMRESMGVRRPQVILVTSPGPGEGKTTIASNLAIALAETNRRVLVLDADFRRPRAHKAFGIANGRGLTDILMEEVPISSYSRESLCSKTSIANLFVITNGSLAQNIAKALYSVRLRELLQRLRNDFDTVIIDAPPMLAVADARVLSSVTDGVVLVLRSGVTEKTSVIEALDQLRADGSVILGTVLNDWKPTKAQAKNNYYYSVAERDRT